MAFQSFEHSYTSDYSIVALSMALKIAHMHFFVIWEGFT